jgi:hypothetical protein
MHCAAPKRSRKGLRMSDDIVAAHLAAALIQAGSQKLDAKTAGVVVRAGSSAVNSMGCVLWSGFPLRRARADCYRFLRALTLAFLRALTWPRLDLGSSISNARSRYQAAIFKNLALRFASVAVLVRS